MGEGDGQGRQAEHQPANGQFDDRKTIGETTVLA
jgi:hypothetical protein